MNTCEEIRAELDAYRDGVLDAARALEIREHLQACPACAAESAQAAAFEQRLRATTENWTPPAGLWARIRASAGSLESRPTSPPRTPRALLPYAAVAGAVFALAVLVAGIDVMQRGDGAREDTLASALVNEFHTFVISRRALDYSSTSPASIRGWFTDKVDFRPPMPASAPGLRLAGGRLCNILDQRVASYMYDSDSAWVSLYIMKSDPSARAPGEGDEATVQGYGYIGWSSDGLRYALVGDVPGHRLRRIADALRAERLAASFSQPGPAVSGRTVEHP